MTVHEKKLGVEFMLPLGEQRKVQNTDLYSLLHIAVVLILLQPVGDLLAEIVEGTVRPVVQIPDLHFNVDQRVVIHTKADIEDGTFIADTFAEDDGIEDVKIFDFFRLKGQESTEQALQDISSLLQ
jgi:hypothetical protein